MEMALGASVEVGLSPYPHLTIAHTRFPHIPILAGAITPIFKPRNPDWVTWYRHQPNHSSATCTHTLNPT